MRKLGNRGDTLVEVLLATVVLSIVLAGAFSLSSRALRLNQTATERTEAVNKMREQTELIRYINQNRDSLSLIWNEIVNHSETTPEATPFYLELFDTGGNIKDLTTISTSAEARAYVPEFNLAGVGGLRTDSYGLNGDIDFFDIWVEPIPDNNNSPAEYIDFVVNVEWEGIGDGNNKQTGASVLRLPL